MNMRHSCNGLCVSVLSIKIDANTILKRKQQQQQRIGTHHIFTQFTLFTSTNWLVVFERNLRVQSSQFSVAAKITR